MGDIREGVTDADMDHARLEFHHSPGIGLSVQMSATVTASIAGPGGARVPVRTEERRHISIMEIAKFEKMALAAGVLTPDDVKGHANYMGALREAMRMDGGMK